MNRTTQARNAIGPLLDELISQLDVEGSKTQRAYFARIRRSLYRAQDDLDLARPILDLSTSPVVGFKFSNDADALIHRILEKAETLGRELRTAPTRPH